MNLKHRVLRIFWVALAASASAVTHAVTVIEYYHEALDAYFITGRANEQNLLDTNAGFRRTGVSFQAADTATGSAALSRICRFYVSAANPFTSSHFYGKEGADCEGLRAQNVPGFLWEGYDFSTVKSDASNACPVGNAPVFRGFRAGVNGKTSNHRYYPSAALCEAGAAAGYVCEGQTFCGGGGVSPPPVSGSPVRTYRGTFRGGQQEIEFTGNVTWSLVAGERGPAGELVYRVSAATANLSRPVSECSTPGAVSIDIASSALAVSEASAAGAAGASVRYGGVFRSIPVTITCGSNPPAQVPFGYVWFTCQPSDPFSNQESPTAARLQGSCNANDGASFAWDFQAVD